MTKRVELGVKGRENLWETVNHLVNAEYHIVKKLEKGEIPDDLKQYFNELRIKIRNTRQSIVYKLYEELGIKDDKLKALIWCIHKHLLLQYENARENYMKYEDFVEELSECFKCLVGIENIAKMLGELSKKKEKSESS